VTPASSRASFPTLRIDDSVLQSYLRSVVAERNRLARELRKTQTKCNKLEEKAQRLKREVDRLKGKLEESARAAKRQAAPFSKGRREKDPKPPGRPRGHAAARRPVPDHIDEDVYESLTSCPRCHGPVTDITDRSPTLRTSPHRSSVISTLHRILDVACVDSTIRVATVPIAGAAFKADTLTSARQREVPRVCSLVPA
jgi:hypothetical protein